MKLLADSWWSDPSFNTGSKITNPALGLNYQAFTGVSFFQALITGLISLSFIVGSIIFFFMLVMGAIQWISSGGDKAGLEASKGKIGNALIGIVILFSAYAVVRLVEVFFGIHILMLNLAPLVIK